MISSVWFRTHSFSSSLPISSSNDPGMMVWSGSEVTLPSGRPWGGMVVMMHGGAGVRELMMMVMMMVMVMVMVMVCE